MGVCAETRRAVFSADVRRNTEYRGNPDRPFFSEIQERACGIWMAGWKNFHERGDGHVS